MFLGIVAGMCLYYYRRLFRRLLVPKDGFKVP